MKEPFILSEEMVWRHIPTDGTGNFKYAIVMVAREIGLPISLDTRKEYIRIIAPMFIVQKLNTVERNPEVTAIEEAECGSMLGRPNVNFQSWSTEFRLQVEAEWWNAKGNKKRALKVLRGLQPLSFEDKKQMARKLLEANK